MPLPVPPLLPASLRRRAELVRQQRPAGVRTPPARLLWRELAVLFGARHKALVHHVARQPGPVMLLPGFGAHPARMRPMAEALERAGHSVFDWGLGFNLGPTPENFAFLLARITRLAHEQAAPLTLVGWSLGGLFARELAKQRPAAVAMVITMGSPFSGDRRANNAWRAYQLVTGHPVDDPPIKGDFAVKPPVPTVALWSPRDGIVAPRSACGWPGERDAAIALRCSHLGFAASPEAIATVLVVLDSLAPDQANGSPG
ncbi:esterase/lipase family protein [Novosphingobium piscinae]|uniref:Alpha/beta hydrolase n=1 Tax=Novosphingobium piscinae TaxID=1507448 RepID=A0A7X1FYH6_9SPHN|nr:alpha/beta fold hydrolase [Novosphingobium piscinae]MBC2669335.1 alpha/beta hydrolase [Novosphingobium piscinae]